MNEFTKITKRGRKPVSGVRLAGPNRPDLIRDEVLAELFADTVRARPGHVAMQDGHRTLTYAEVWASAASIARGLMASGVGAGSVVGLWMPRGIDLLVAQIGVTLSGAAWLPFDADAPVDRIATCLADCGAGGIVTAEGWTDKAKDAGVAVWTPAGLTAADDGSEIPARAAGLTPDHPAYMIYTSGSTGKPKGIVISHRNITHFLRAAVEVYGFNGDDIVFQGASVAFDLSMEEIWAPYLAGATLHVASPQVMGDIENLPNVLDEAGVTVMDTVPTLLGVLPRDVPKVRVIILGGEALPPAVLARWSQPGRRIFNSYGPTEATVVATAAELKAGEPVTIGRPIPNYTCYIVNEGGELCQPGEQGELWIGGPGVAVGYLQRPELTAEKFVANPFGGVTDPRLYRSGDAVSLDGYGNIAFHGRIDDQVKIRGFRVELGEIESKLADEPGIAQAAVVLRHEDGIDKLVAFLVPDAGKAIDRAALRAAMRAKLPPYMIPGHYEEMTALPILAASGKVDRKALKAAPLTIVESAVTAEPETETEAVLLAAAKPLFKGQAVAFDLDFFTEMGGHSLVAAQFISAVRQSPQHAMITLQDVYNLRTLRAIGQALDERIGAGGGGVQDLSFEPPPFWRRFWCGAAQALAMPFILGLVTVQWLGLFLSSVFLIKGEAGILYEMAVLCSIFVLLNLGAKLTIVALKWIIIGRTKPGRYPLWGVYYFRVWFVARLIQATTPKFLQMSPLMRVWIRLLGGKVGKEAIIAEFETGAWDMISIGERASTGSKMKLATVEFSTNEMIIAPVEIGPYAHIGNACVISGGSTVSEGAELRDLTCVLPGQTVPAWEIWDGSPPRKVGMVDRAKLPVHPEASKPKRALLGVGYFGVYTLMLMIGLIPIFPAFYVLYNLDYLIGGELDYTIAWSQLLLYTWPTAMILIAASMVIVVALRWLIFPRRIKPGSYSVYSVFYFRKWSMALATEVLLETLNSLFATIYMRYWYLMMGAKIGKGSELSTNLAGRYDLVDIGKGNFIGDEAIFGDEDVRCGYMRLDTVKTGDRVFFGNAANVAAGSVIEDGALIGVKSKLPDSLHVKKDETWFGSPAIKFPTRQKVSLGASETYEPPKRMFALRAVFEGLHTSLPTAVFLMVAYMTADTLEGFITSGQYGIAVLIVLAAGVFNAVAMVLMSVAIKWAMMGVYRPVMKPMWSFWAMRTEAVAVIYGGLAGKVGLEYMRGTPFLPWMLRLYGTKIGKGVLMDWTDITEFDCTRIGDYSVLNAHSCPQTHLYEDRVMKVGRIEIGKGVTISSGSIVLYDTKVGDWARIEPLTMVMKGEHIPANSMWQGAPAVPYVAHKAKEHAAA